MRKNTYRDTPGYSRWKGIKNRCLRPEVEAFPRYGGRGITICERWLTFANFIADVGLPPFPGAMLEREDNSRGYEPGNVCWATADEQNRNKRNNVWITVDDVTLVRKDWARRLGVKDGAVVYQAKKRGSYEAAVRYFENKKSVGL
jgi:hypothetical protein